MGLLFFSFLICFLVLRGIERDPELISCVWLMGNADSSFVPPLVYAMMGSSRDLAVGTVAVASLLMASMLGKEVSAAENPTLYLHLAFTATFFAGVFQSALGFLRLVFFLCKNARKLILLGREKKEREFFLSFFLFFYFLVGGCGIGEGSRGGLVCLQISLYFIITRLLFYVFFFFLTLAVLVYNRLGLIVDFLSHATIVGFMAGAATVVCLQQLKGILGLEHFTTATDLVSVMRSIFSQTHQVPSQNQPNT